MNTIGNKSKKDNIKKDESNEIILAKRLLKGGKFKVVHTFHRWYYKIIQVLGGYILVSSHHQKVGLKTMIVYQTLEDAKNAFE